MACCDGGDEGEEGGKTLLGLWGAIKSIWREAGGGGGFERVVEGGGNGYDCTEPFRRGLRCCLGPQMSKKRLFGY